MMNVKYSDIIGVRPNFDDTFNMTQERPDSWKSFITNSQFESNLKKIIRAFTAPVSTNNSNVSIADELLKLKQLLDMGVLSQEEFDEQKNKLLNK